MALKPLSSFNDPTPRGLGEKIAGASLPGPGARYRGDQWGLNRPTWAHPWMPGAAGDRFDAKMLQRKIMEDAAIDGGLDPSAVAEMTLEELLVLPDVQEALRGAVISSALSPLAAPPLSELDEGANYIMGNVGGSVMVSGTASAANAVTMTRTTPTPGEIYLMGAMMSLHVSNPDVPHGGSIYVGIEGYGPIFSHDTNMNTVDSHIVTLDLGGVLMVRQSQLRVDMRSSFAGSDATVHACVVLSYRRAFKKQ